MMKLVIFSCLVAVALAKPAGPNNPEPVPIISQENQVNPDGSYVYSFETGDGVKAQQEGRVLPAENKDETDAIGQIGSFSYTSPDGTVISVRYVADKEGFKPEGDHLPVAPEIPAAIARSIQYNQEHPEQNQA